MVLSNGGGGNSVGELCAAWTCCHDEGTGGGELCAGAPGGGTSVDAQCAGGTAVDELCALKRAIASMASSRCGGMLLACAKIAGGSRMGARVVRPVCMCALCACACGCACAD